MAKDLNALFNKARKTSADKESARLKDEAERKAEQREKEKRIDKSVAARQKMLGEEITPFIEKLREVKADGSFIFSSGVWHADDKSEVSVRYDGKNGSGHFSLKIEDRNAVMGNGPLTRIIVRRCDKTEWEWQGDNMQSSPIAMEVKSPDEAAGQLAEWVGVVATPDEVKMIFPDGSGATPTKRPPARKATAAKQHQGPKVFQKLTIKGSPPSP